MKNACFRRWIFLWLLICTCPVSIALSSEICEEPIGKVVSVQGKVEVRRAGQALWQKVLLNQNLCPGDMIRTGERSRAAIMLVYESSLRLDQMTTLTIRVHSEKKSSFVDLLKGGIHFFSRVRQGLKVMTPFVNGSVEGTEFYVRVEPDHTLISVFEGQVLAANDQGGISLSNGQSALARAGQEPHLRIIAHPREGVHWALYYPPLLNYQPDDFPGKTENDWQAMVRRSLEHYWKNDIFKAFTSLDKISGDISDPRFFIYRAGLLLGVGRLDEARKDIQKAARLEPKDSQSFSLESIIAIALNQKTQARHLAEKAVELDKASASARIALSYAQQSLFDLNGALESLKEAVALDTENGLAWARLSELFLSVGNLKKALEAAKRSAALNPFLERSQTVLGFAYIAQIEILNAALCFRRAIELDPSAPLPRLGLGLALIREGHLKEGRGEIEVAVSLDPGNSLIRSYLGKAYFEEKRDSLAGNQFVLAKTLDPGDPTPWFYNAILKQTINRPVEALHDLQKSIELNDNRAVYRSRLLLDEDLATRSSSLSRIYSDLQFSQLALAEGYKSLNTDPSNHSAHRFLANSYSVLPRHEIAQVSERLQSQLLQPINIQPVSPELIQGSPYILEMTGPSSSSFNEFNQLFNRNRISLQASGVAADNSTWGEELIFSGVLDKLSFSLGQYHNETDGFRKNNDQHQNIKNAFVQLSFSPQTSIQTEYRKTDKENGDLSLLFDPDIFFPSLRGGQETETLRLGFHHAFSPNSRFIASFIYQDKEWEIHYPDYGFGFVDEENGFMTEGQHLFRSQRLNLINGLGYFSADRKSIEEFAPSLKQIYETDISHTNLYTYAYLHYPDRFTWIAGASGDFLKGAIVDKEQLNPKFGVIWNPYPATTVRAAIFRTLQRTLLSSQTLEPTQVAGFNQFFLDAEGVESWRYGIGVDQKFSRNLYGGLELSKRDMDVPFEYGYIPDLCEADWKENLVRAYLYWTPKKWMALSADYLYEAFERNSGELDSPLFNKVDTHRLPIGVSFFHSAGFILRFKTTYVYQDGQFSYPGIGIVPGNDRFWVTDAGIGYRLPKRFGMISLEVKNLFDREFNFQDTDPENPGWVSNRLFMAKFTLSF